MGKRITGGRSLWTYKKMIKDKKQVKGVILRIFIIAFAVWIFWPYVEMGYLSWKYGKYFEEGYRQSQYFADDPYMKPRVLRYREEKARVATDSGLVKIMLEEDAENTAVVCYSSALVMVFEYDGTEWKMARHEDGKGGRWIMLWSSTANNLIWPYYL